MAIFFENIKITFYGVDFFEIMKIAFSGGGIKNLSLMALINKKLNGRKIQSTTDWGIAPEWVEAAGFAFLAHQRIQEKVVDLTKTTGSKKKSILGAIYLPPQ